MKQQPSTDSAAVLEFWFEEIEPAKWWKKNAAFDQRIRHRFGRLHEQAASGELHHWRADAHGRLAEIIVLDQFSRNIWRDDPRAFAWDGMALVLAQEAVVAGADEGLPAERQAFMYMPYMHSESLAIHQTAMQLFAAPGLESNLKFEKRHLEILQRFGRYPHRNAILGRESTAEEEAFLLEPGSSF